MFPVNRDYHCLCKSVWQWRRACFFYKQRYERQPESAGSDEHFLYYGVRKWNYSDDSWYAFCKTSAGTFWSIWGCFGLCISLHDDLPDRNGSIHDRYRNEPVYQCTGIRDNWYAFCSNRCSCQSDPGSIIHFCAWFRNQRSSHCDCSFPVSISCLCTSFSWKKSGNESSSFEKNRAEKLQRECKKHCQSWYCRLHYAADKQSGNYLLQQCSGGHRRGCLHIRYDYRIQCPSDGRDADLCYKWRHITYPELQLRGQETEACPQGNGHSGSNGPGLYSSNVERDYLCSGLSDCHFQLR